MVLNSNDATPCGVLFDLLKRRGGISHRDLAELILSSRPLSDGKSPLLLANDRVWLSRFVVRAPVGSVQEQYFCDYGTAAMRVMARLRSRRRIGMTSEEVLNLVVGKDGLAMDRALAVSHQDAQLYRNALERLAHSRGHAARERAEVALVLFIAAGCSANARRAVTYTMEYTKTVYGGYASTPQTTTAASRSEIPVAHAEAPHPLGLIRAQDGYVSGNAHWIAPDSHGVEIGALATGENDIVDVGEDVSARHARVWCEVPSSDGGVIAAATWFVEDLGSTNGTVLVSGADGSSAQLVPGQSVELSPGDELRLGLSTAFIVIEGAYGAA